MKLKQCVIYFLLIGAILLCSIAPLQASTFTTTNLKNGQEIPDYKLTQLNGDKTSLSTLHFPVLVTVFTTWCGVCKVELDELNSSFLSARKSGKTLSIIAINAGEKESKVNKYVMKKGLKFPVYLDQNLEFTQGINIQGTPTILIFDANKKLIYQGNELPKQWESKITL